MANSTLKDRSGRNGKNNMKSLNIPVGPRETTIQNILNFSKAMRIENSETVGPIETILN